MSGKKVQKQFDDINAEEWLVERTAESNVLASESFSVKEQELSDVTNVSSVNNQISFDVQSFKQLTGR